MYLSQKKGEITKISFKYAARQTPDMPKKSVIKEIPVAQIKTRQNRTKRIKQGKARSFVNSAYVDAWLVQELKNARRLVDG